MYREYNKEYNKNTRYANKNLNNKRALKRYVRFNYDNFYKLIVSIILILFVALNFRIEVKENVYIESDDVYATVIDFKIK